MSRVQLEYRYNHLYLKLAPSDVKNLHKCFYCGMQVECLDHVPPISIAHAFLHKTNESYYKVPSCNSCNQIASDKPHTDICNRKIYIQKKIKEKNKKTLSVREAWTEADIDDFIEDNGNTSIIESVKAEILLSCEIIERISFEGYDFINIRRGRDENYAILWSKEYSSEDQLINCLSKHFNMSMIRVKSELVSFDMYESLEYKVEKMSMDIITSCFKGITSDVGRKFRIDKNRMLGFIIDRSLGITDELNIHARIGDAIEAYFKEYHKYDAEKHYFI